MARMSLRITSTYVQLDAPQYLPYVFSLPSSLLPILVNAAIFHPATQARSLRIIWHSLLPRPLLFHDILLILFLKYIPNPSLFLHPQWPWLLIPWFFFSNIVLTNLFSVTLALKILSIAVKVMFLICKSQYVSYLLKTLHSVFCSKSSIYILDGPDFVQRDWPACKIFSLSGLSMKRLDYFSIFMLTTNTLLAHFRGPSRGYGYTPSWKPKLVF